MTKKKTTIYRMYQSIKNLRLMYKMAKRGTRSKKYVCYKGYGANKSGNHTEKQFKKTMRKHHLYDCIDKLCLDTKDKEICTLSRKCNRRNKRKRIFTAKKWVKWTNARYGKCKK